MDSHWLEKQFALPAEEWTTASSASSEGRDPDSPGPASLFVDEFPAAFRTEKENADRLTSDNLVTLSLSQEGSFQVQEYLQQAQPDQVEQALRGLLPAINDLVTHQFGNYVGQALVQTLSPEQRCALLQATHSHLQAWAFHDRSTYVLQTLAQQCSSAAEESIYAQAFCGNVRQMAIHKYASHVLQKLIPNLQGRAWIVKELMNCCRVLALDKYGVCVLKKLVNEPVILRELEASTLELMQDPYGKNIYKSTRENTAKSQDSHNSLVTSSTKARLGILAKLVLTKSKNRLCAKHMKRRNVEGNT